MALSAMNLLEIRPTTKVEATRPVSE